MARYETSSRSNSSTRRRKAWFSASSSCARWCFRARQRLAEIVFCRRLRSTADKTSAETSSIGPCEETNEEVSGGDAEDDELPEDVPLGRDPLGSSVAVASSLRFASRRCIGIGKVLRAVLAGKTHERGWIGASSESRGIDGDANPVGSGRVDEEGAAGEGGGPVASVARSDARKAVQSESARSRWDTLRLA